MNVAEIGTKWVFSVFNEQKVHPFYECSPKNKITLKTYDLSCHETKSDFQKTRLVTITDIPEYLEALPIKLPKNFKTLSIEQYPGFLMDLSQSSTPDVFLKQQLSKRSIKRLNKKIKGLNQNGSIVHKVFKNTIAKDEYLFLMGKLKSFLESRFHQKQIHNRYLEKWDHYLEMAYKKINQGYASLFVLYEFDKPICITLNFHQSDLIFSELEGYDTAYSNYNLGDISMLKHLEWCFSNHVSIIDLAMGKTQFKEKWSNKTYSFYCHLHYNKRSLVALGLLQIQRLKLTSIQYLRNIGIVGGIIKFDKIKYRINRL